MLKQVKTKLEKFTYAWNADENNRDKTFTVFNELKDTKTEIQESIKLMLERDGKIEESLLKTNQMKVVANNYKKKTVEVNTMMNRRKWCLRIVGGAFAVGLAGLLIWWVAGIFSS